MELAQERAFEIEGFVIAGKAWGKKTAHPVLCLHGLLDNAASFDFLAPLLFDHYLIALDSPGTGLSSHYPPGLLPYWKNDALLMMQLTRSLGWQQFSIIGHSFGTLPATMMALHGNVDKLVFIDTLGPKADFIEKSIEYLNRDVNFFLKNNFSPPTFSSINSAIEERMKTGPLSFAAAQTLIHRGTKVVGKSVITTSDQRLKCVSMTLPQEDELRMMFGALNVPVCLIRGQHGLFYPNELFQERAESIKNLSIHSLEGGHHVHMENPKDVAHIIREFFTHSDAETNNK